MNKELNNMKEEKLNKVIQIKHNYEQFMQNIEIMITTPVPKNIKEKTGYQFYIDYFDDVVREWDNYEMCIRYSLKK